MKKNKKIIFPVLLVLILFAIGTSFALWQITYTQKETNIITTDCFKVTFEDENPINIQEAYPITDTEGKSLTPYKFTLTNMCDSFATYDINLETLNTSTLEELDHIKIMLNETEQEEVARLLSSSTQVDNTLDNAITSYKIGTGYLDYKESKTFELRLWLDENTPLDEKYMSKTLENKVTIVTSFTSDMPLDTRNMMMERYDENNADNYDFMKDTTQIVFRNKKTNPTDVEVIDISYNKDNSVVAYNDSSTGSKITYIEANGKIKFPINSSNLFEYYVNLAEIDGLNLIDTRQVSNMHELFLFCEKLSNLDLSNFDTSRVTDMSGMFSRCFKLESLSLDNFDTSNVINMSNMFAHCKVLNSLDLSNFDTSKVTSIRQMFLTCSALTSLDISNFDTSNVTDMIELFSNCNKLTALDLSNFDTSSVTNMSRIFKECYVLTTTLTIKSNQTSNYSEMFFNSANSKEAQITVNYTTESSDLVDRMITTKSTNSNVVKGVKVD